MINRVDEPYGHAMRFLLCSMVLAFAAAAMTGCDKAPQPKTSGLAHASATQDR